MDAVVGIESRGFLFGVPIADRLGLPFVPVRKPGKLPAAHMSVEYSLEYGTGTLDIHSDALGAGDRVVVVDDLLATGGRRWRRASWWSCWGRRWKRWCSWWTCRRSGAGATDGLPGAVVRHVRVIGRATVVAVACAD